MQIDYGRRVLTSDVHFEGWTTETWTRFVELWKPRATPVRELTRPRGGIIAIHDRGRLRKLFHTKTGRLGPHGAWPVPLSELAMTHHASWALSAEMGALEELMERFGARLERSHDLTAQSLLLITIVHEMLQEGLVERWPMRLQGVPPPTAPMVRHALDAICPDGFAIVLGLFHNGELWTAGTLRRQGTGFDVFAGPEELRPRMGVLSGDWRRDYRHLGRAVEEHYAPVALGCFAEVNRFRELSIDPRAGAWSRAAVVRDVVISPMPMAVRLALGADGARFAIEGIRAIVGQSESFRRLEPWAENMRKRLGDAAGHRGVSHALGFDPVAALRTLLRR
ncbi:MAG: hypothetical protein FWD69_03250 [Polyangiaceae bacterium]|nr:hypothetical protein [Polyangiaceae bacterium]